MITWNALDDHSAHIIIKGRLDMHTSPELRQRLKDLRAQGNDVLYLDASEVDFMSSSGLAVVVAALRAARRQDGELCLISPSEAILTVLDYTRLHEVIPIFKDLESARAHIQARIIDDGSIYHSFNHNESNDEDSEALS